MSASEDWYRNRDNWHGSSLEVAIELGARHDDRLIRAVRAAWSSPHLHGPDTSPYGEPPEPIDQTLVDPDAGVHTYGTMYLPNGRRTGCTVSAVRDDVSDWLDVAIPTGMLELTYPVEYPLMDETNPWIAAVERRLVDIANEVFAAVPFDLGIVGEVASGLFFANSSDENQVTRDVVDRGGGFLLSPGLWERLRPSAETEILESGLRWVPPTGRSYWED